MLRSLPVAVLCWLALVLCKCTEPRVVTSGPFRHHADCPPNCLSHCCDFISSPSHHGWVRPADSIQAVPTTCAKPLKSTACCAASGWGRGASEDVIRFTKGD